MTARESRPGVQTEAANVHPGGLNDDSSLQASSVKDTGYDRARQRVDHAFVAVVQNTHGTYRRRVFLSLKPAETAVRRSRENGLDAHVIICELRTVAGQDGRGRA